MPIRWETLVVPLANGLRTDLAPIQLGLADVGAARGLTNFECSLTGGYQRILGYSKWDANPVPAVDSANLILGVGFFEGSVIAAREDKVFTSSGGGWTQIASGRTQTTKHRFHQYNLAGTQKIIGTDSSNYPYVWDGSTFSDIDSTTDPLGASIVVDFADHVVYAVGGLLLISAPFDENDFTPANGALTINIKDEITGLIVFREKLFVFTENSVSALQGTSSADFVLQSVSETVGCSDPDSIQEISGDVMFLSKDGVRMLGATDRIGDFSNQTSSSKIRDNFIKFISDYNEFNATVVRNKAQYRLFGWTANRETAESEGYIGTQFEPQNPQSFSWSISKGIKVRSIDSKVEANEEFIVFSSDTDYVYRMESGNSFDGTGIESIFRTPYFSFNDPLYRKTQYAVTVYLQATGAIAGEMSPSLDLGTSRTVQPNSQSFSIDGGSARFGEAVFGVDTFSGEIASDYQLHTTGSGQNCSYSFEFEGGEPFKIDTLAVEYATEDRL